MSVACTATYCVHRLSGSGSPLGSRSMLPSARYWSEESKKKSLIGCSASACAAGSEAARISCPNTDAVSRSTALRCVGADQVDEAEQDPVPGSRGATKATAALPWWAAFWPRPPRADFLALRGLEAEAEAAATAAAARPPRASGGMPPAAAFAASPLGPLGPCGRSCGVTFWGGATLWPPATAKVGAARIFQTAKLRLKTQV
mmetsp:Transcript_40113/g.118917  ORF Transcript_40113/g.118917 Transcript_40113/m.118917 type:complete len:202 (+) Transcript_40113:230-835(+)